MVSYLYADDGFLKFMGTERIQQEFHVLTELFDWVLLRTNVGKMVIMACQPCRATEGHSIEAYDLWMMGEGRTY